MLKIQTFKPENSYIKALIYGPSGAGKTTFAATAPKPIFASSEKGLMSIRHLSPQFAEINSLQDLKDLYSFLKNEKHEFETVVIDSITEINDIIKTEIETRNKRNMQLQDWGILQKEIKDILRKFRDLPMHIIFLAQETTEKDEEKIVKYLPSLNGKSATEIAYYMDTVGYCFIDKLGNRKIGTMPNEKYLTKDRTNVIDGGENQNFSEWVEAMKKGIAVTPTTSEKTDEKTTEKVEKKSVKKTTKNTEQSIDEKANEQLFLDVFQKMREELNSSKTLEEVNEVFKHFRQYVADKIPQEMANEFVQRVTERRDELALATKPALVSQPEPASVTELATDDDDEESCVAESVKLVNRQKAEKNSEKTEEKSAKETTKASEDTEPKMATEYQISTLVGMIKKLAGEIPYAEQKNKYRATIAAICSRDVWAEGLEEMSAVLTLQEAAKVIGYLKTKIS